MTETWISQRLSVFLITEGIHLVTWIRKYNSYLDQMKFNSYLEVANQMLFPGSKRVQQLLGSEVVKRKFVSYYCDWWSLVVTVTMGNWKILWSSSDWVLLMVHGPILQNLVFCFLKNQYFEKGKFGISVVKVKPFGCTK